MAHDGGGRERSQTNRRDPGPKTNLIENSILSKSNFFEIQSRCLVFGTKAILLSLFKIQISCRLILQSMISEDEGVHVGINTTTNENTILKSFDPRIISKVRVSIFEQQDNVMSENLTVNQGADTSVEVFPFSLISRLLLSPK